jgi:acetyltransferase-like isoleucine patch superfamily enzyme
MKSKLHHDSPAISVIIAVRNAECTLRVTIESLLAQSVQDFEIILIDGASTDATLDIAKMFSNEIKVLLSEPDSGIADAWNKGLRCASGKWIMFLNAGDMLHTDHFLRALPLLTKVQNEPIVLYCDVLKFNSRGESVAIIRGKMPDIKIINKGGIGFGHPGSLASAKCFEQIGGFNLDLRIAIDTDWLLRAFKAGYRFQYFASTAYMSEGGISDRNFSDAIKEYFSCAMGLGLVAPWYARLAVFLLPQFRMVLHVYRAKLRNLLRIVKHAAIFFANGIESLLPFFWLRRVYFYLLGFHLAGRSSIGLGFKFYKRGHISIGEGSVINRSCLFDNRDQIKIGKQVSIARDVSIFTAGHDAQSPLFEMTTAPVSIDDHVVIFAGAMVMPGVHIGYGAVVHAGAVVTRDVDSMAIVGGVPAKIVGRRKMSPLYTLNYPFPLAM